MTDLVEVFSVQVFSNQSKDRSIKGGELYGAIWGNDYSGDTVFFKQGGGRSDDSILPDGTLSLTGPSRCNKGESWGLGLKLYLKKNHEDLELCNGFLKICAATCDRYNNKPICGTVSGRDGYALVNLVSLTNAVQATVEVSLLESVGHAFYGHILARNNLRVYKDFYKRKFFQTTLLSASQDKPLYKEGRKIPLARRVTAVPIWRHLIIKAQLFGMRSQTSVVADGEESFLARPCGEETRIIGLIEVKVTWTSQRSSNRESSPA